jgi:hypothetical protein
VDVTAKAGYWLEAEVSPDYGKKAISQPLGFERCLANTHSPTTILRSCSMAFLTGYGS